MEHLGSESWHETAQVLNQDGAVDPVKQIIALLLVFNKELQVFEHPLLNGYKLVIVNGILTQNVKLDTVLFALDEEKEQN